MNDDIFLPDESEVEAEDFDFEQKPIDAPKTDIGDELSGVKASNFVKISFGRFVTLVANHSFSEVVDENKDEEIIISTNLLMDLANARRFIPAARVPLMIVSGILIGILFGYFIFNGA